MLLWMLFSRRYSMNIILCTSLKSLNINLYNFWTLSSECFFFKSNPLKASLWMPISVCVKLSDLFLSFLESFIFYRIMSFKILNIAVKCSRSSFLNAPIRPLLKRGKTRTGIFLASAEIISMLKYERYYKLLAKTFHLPKYKKLFNKSGFFLLLGSESYFLKYKKVPLPEIYGFFSGFSCPEI